MATPHKLTSEREVWVCLTRAEITSLLDQHPDRWLMSADEKLREALNADKAQEAEDALPRCPDCQIAPDRGPDVPCPVCDDKREQQARERDVYGAGYEAAMDEGVGARGLAQSSDERDTP